MSSPLGVAIAAAQAAGDRLLRYYGALDPSEVTEKAKFDYVSRADRESEAILREAILSAFPHDVFVGEESGATAGDPDAPAWIVDPLDGTANFVQGFPHFAVSIGRTEGGPLGRLTLGVVWDPLKGDLFVAERGKGATRNDKRIRLPERPGLEGAALATGFPFRIRGRIDRYLSVFREVFLVCRSVRRAGSAALDLAYVAAGIFDGFFELALSPWDTAAGAVLVEEAGGVVTDWSGGGDWRTSGDVLAGSPAVHKGLVETIARVGRAEPEL